VNTARGGVIESNAVLKGLADGIIGAVGLDVVNGEFQSTQLPVDPLVEASFTDPRIIITPHAGGSTHDAHAKVFGKVAELIENITN
jgi:phosphoglycerate dehydrogenase-like enzyme